MATFSPQGDGISALTISVLIVAIYIAPIVAYLHISQPFRAILYEQLLDEVFGYRIHVLRPLNLAAENLFVDAERIVIVEWREAGEHFVN